LNLFQNALQYAEGITTRMANHIAMLAWRQHVSCAIAGKEYRFDADHFFWCGKGSDWLDASD
jgi:hypothetical protein